MITSLAAAALLAPMMFAELPLQDPTRGARQVPQGRSFAVLLLPAADRDRNGAIQADEWSTFVESLGAGPDGSLDRDAVRAALLMPALDRDGDGSVTPADIDAALGGATPPRGDFALAMLIQIADTDRDGSVSDAERTAAVAGAAGDDGRIDRAVIAQWVRRVEADVPEDRRAFTASTYLVTMRTWLDAKADGELTTEDLEMVRANLDTNGDGVLSPDEFAPRRRARTGGGWGGRITESDRAKPGLVAWQRSLDDALLLQQRTGKPLLIAVNADGEPASEGLAWKRYRDPQFAEWANGFVCVVTSPDQRNARDHDDRGRRIEDWRFGRVVNSEVIANELAAFERYFGGRREAPRHIGIAADGTVLFDLALLNDLGDLDAALRQHGHADVRIPEAEKLSEHELLISPDAGHRAFLEQRFAAGDEPLRSRLTRAALVADRDVQHPELLRLALRDPSSAVRSAGIDALAELGTAAMLGMFRTALHAARDDAGERTRLIDRLWRIADSGEGAEDVRTRAALWGDLQAGLSLRSGLIDIGAWRTAMLLAGTPEPAPTADERDLLDAGLARLEMARREQPSPELDVELARLTLRYALSARAAGQDPTFLLEDARANAVRAIASAPEDGRSHACAAWASHLRDDGDAALRHATAAVAHLLPHAGSRAAANVLAIYAQRRVQQIYDAMRAGQRVAANWVADVNAAYAVLLDHPATEEAWLGAYLDWLDQVGGWGIEADAAPRAVARFPNSAAMHERWRGQLLRDGGARAIEAAYDTAPPASADPATWDWFRGLAELVAAERHVLESREADALAPYARSVEAFDASVAANDSYRDSATHYQALALAGLARSMAERGDLDAAASLARAALDKRPASAASPDGLGVTPRATALRVADLLERAGRDADAATLRQLAQAGS